MTKLKDLRRACKGTVTQQDLAEHLNLSQPAVSRLENNEEAFKRMPMSQALMIADLLGIEVSELYE